VLTPSLLALAGVGALSLAAVAFAAFWAAGRFGFGLNEPGA